MKSKVLMVQPLFMLDKLKSAHINTESLAVAYLTSALRAKQIEVEAVHAAMQSMDNHSIVQKVIKEQFNIVGLSCSAQRAYPETLDLAREIKKECPSVYIILGGHFISLVPDLIVKYTDVFDFIIRCDGEEVLCELIDCIEKKRGYETVPGITYKNQEGIIINNEDPPMMYNLDDIPFPDRSYIPNVLDEALSGVREISIIASRGCNHRCIYCSVTHCERRRSPENVVEEMKELHKEYGIWKFNFKDDLLFGRSPNNKKWSARLADLLISELPNMELRGMARPDSIDEELFIHLHKAGFQTIMMGIESGSMRVLKRFKKNTDVDLNLKAVRTLQKIGIKPLYGFIFFEPDMNLEDIYENINFLKKVGDFTRHNLTDTLSIYYGSELYEQWVKEGRINKEFSFEDHHPYSFSDPSVQIFYDTVQWMKKQFYPIRKAIVDITLLSNKYKIMLYHQKVDLHNKIKNNKVFNDCASLEKDEAIIWMALYEQIYRLLFYSKIITLDNVINEIKPYLCSYIDILSKEAEFIRSVLVKLVEEKKEG